jgi:hypothetical protein
MSAVNEQTNESILFTENPMSEAIIPKINCFVP